VVNLTFLHASRKLADELFVMVYLELARLRMLVGRLAIRHATDEVVSCSSTAVSLRRYGEHPSLYHRRDTHGLSRYL